ncbi:hypothetical protein XarbCFBP7408_09250 [Xanthomonas arboricola pv. guizotiae]|uniref:Uncharacterized protein n=1 Tax=Xanthomonas arboricola pv. guizotiae TaxID=487867 RepID=A0A2S7A547_9XANT|nr:hypothetical protein XarbCFBP7409_05550 [Xanthomonas arboricola pv. guizotiae]PPU24162.1 hypothetical protein XarbCFBP7408_09250 [Xanthomonas arboricola pv. guizotiae]
MRVESVAIARLRVRRAVMNMQPWMAVFRRTLTPTPAPLPGPRLRRGRAKARAPVTRKPCLGAPRGEAYPFSLREKVARSAG